MPDLDIRQHGRYLLTKTRLRPIGRGFPDDAVRRAMRRVLLSVLLEESAGHRSYLKTRNAIDLAQTGNSPLRKTSRRHLDLWWRAPDKVSPLRKNFGRRIRPVRPFPG